MMQRLWMLFQYLFLRKLAVKQYGWLCDGGSLYKCKYIFKWQSMPKHYRWVWEIKDSGNAY